MVDDGGGDTFKKMAQAFQEDRDTKGMNGKKKKNNIWGSFIQEAFGTGERIKPNNSLTV